MGNSTDALETDFEWDEVRANWYRKDASAEVRDAIDAAKHTQRFLVDNDVIPARGSNRPDDHQGRATVISGHAVDEKRLRYPAPEPSDKLSEEEVLSLSLLSDPGTVVNGSGKFYKNATIIHSVPWETVQRWKMLKLIGHAKEGRHGDLEITDAGRDALAAL